MHRFTNLAGSPPPPSSQSVAGPTRRGALAGADGAGDLADLLPKVSRERLRGWRQLRDETRAALEPARQRIDEARRQRDRAQAQLEELQRWDRNAGGKRAENDPSVATAKKWLERATQDFDAAREHADALHYRSKQINGLVNAAEDWLRRVPSDAIVKHAPVEPKLKKAEALNDAIARFQSEIDQLVADQHAVASAPIHSRDAKKKAHAQIEALAARGQPDVWHVLEGAGDIEWPEATIDAEVAGNAALADGAFAPVSAHAAGRVGDGVALVAFLFKDRLIAAVEVEIDALADDSAALTQAERADKSNKLAAAILAKERDLVAIFDAAGELPPAEIDARALLGVDY
jgi:DNA repair exonuclease SbcCD ATPase subunit